jgi:hypothetical protein
LTNPARRAYRSAERHTSHTPTGESRMTPRKPKPRPDENPVRDAVEAARPSLEQIAEAIGVTHAALRNYQREPPSFAFRSMPDAERERLADWLTEHARELKRHAGRIRPRKPRPSE